MTATSRQRAIARLALAAGVVLFLVALRYTDWQLILSTGPRLLLSIVFAIAVSGLWHLARTVAWAWCFSSPRRVGLVRLFRVRIAAEAISYVTLRGIAGEPLKVVLLSGQVNAREATAAVALERLAYTIATTAIVGVGATIALLALPLSRVWVRVFGVFAAVSGSIVVLTIVVLSGRGTYLSRLRRVSGRSLVARIARFIGDVETELLTVARADRVRLLVLASGAVAAYLLMALEAWAILRAAGIPVTFTGAVVIETFSRAASFASAFIPANLGALEAASVAATSAAGVAGGGPLALARRVRGLFWAAVGFTLYPRQPRHARQTALDTSPRTV